jgi:hypothetical protein
VLYLAGTPESLRADFREAKVLDLALFLQLLHLKDRLLDRGLLVHAVAVIEIHTVNAEPFQRLLGRLAAVLGGRVCFEARPVGVHRQSEFGGEEDLLALAGVLLEPLACSKPSSDKDLGDTRERQTFETYLGDPRCHRTHPKCPKRADHPGTAYREP